MAVVRLALVRRGQEQEETMRSRWFPHPEVEGAEQRRAMDSRHV